MVARSRRKQGRTAGRAKATAQLRTDSAAYDSPVKATFGKTLPRGPRGQAFHDGAHGRRGRACKLLSAETFTENSLRTPPPQMLLQALALPASRTLARRLALRVAKRKSSRACRSLLSSGDDSSTSSGTSGSVLGKRVCEKGTIDQLQAAMYRQSEEANKPPGRRRR